MVRNRSELAISRRALVRAAGALGASALCGAGFLRARRRARPARATRGSSSSSCAARSTASPPFRRSAIRTMRRCTAISPSPPPANAPPCRSTASSASTPRSPPSRRLYDAEAGDGRPRGRDGLPRPLAFRRPGRAGKRQSRAGSHRERLAQPDAWPRCPPRHGRDARARRRRDRAARHPRTGAGARLGAAGRPRAGERDLTQRVLDLYAHRDPPLGERLRAALAAEKVASERRRRAIR